MITTELILLSVAGFIVAFFLLRWLHLWAWKINKRVRYQKKIADYTETITRQNEGVLKRLEKVIELLKKGGKL